MTTHPLQPRHAPRPDWRPLNIAVVGMRGLPSGYSGIERVGEELYPGLAARGHRVTVFARPSSASASASVYGGVSVRRAGAIAWSPLETLSHAFFALPRVAVGGRFDIVHLHALAPALTSAAYRLAGVPVVLTVHGLDWQRAKWKGTGSVVLRRAEGCGVRHADEIIVVSQDLQDYYRRVYGRQTTVIHNAIELFNGGVTPDAREVEGFGLESGRYIIFLGRLVPEKRIEDAIHAFRGVRTDFKFAVVGADECRYAERLRELARPDPRVRFLGHVARSQVLSLLGSAAAFVLPSELEGFPLALIEAACLGIPSVVSDIPPHRELLGAAANDDLLFPVGDREALAHKLARVLAAPDEHLRAARSASVQIRGRLSVERMLDLTEEVLLRAAGVPRPHVSINADAEGRVHESAF